MLIQRQRPQRDQHWNSSLMLWRCCACCLPLEVLVIQSSAAGIFNVHGLRLSVKAKQLISCNGAIAMS